MSPRADHDALELLAKRLGQQLVDDGHMLALAESCTGGLVAQSVTTIAGSSHWFDRGFVTYSNEAKSEMLGVPAALMQAYGAVSEPVAAAMANGALQFSRASVVGAITGIAGPTGGSVQKPVGTVCFAIAFTRQAAGPRCKTYTRHFTGDRSAVRLQAAHQLMQDMLALLQGALLKD